MPPKSLNSLTSLFRFKFVIGLVALVVLAPISLLGSRAALSSMFNSPAHWLPDNLPVRKTYDEFSKLFQGQNVLLISWQGCQIGSPEIPLVIEGLQTFLATDADVPAELKYFDTIRNGPPTSDAEWIGRRIATPEYFEGLTSGQAVYDLLNRPPASFSDSSVRARLSGALIGPDGNQTVLLATFSDQGIRRRSDAVAKVQALVSEIIGIEPSKVYLAGTPIDGALIDLEAQASVRKYTIPSCLLGALICFLCLRSWLLTGVVIAVATIGQGMSLAVVAAFGLEMNAILIVLPPLVFVLTASAGIHLSNYYLDELAKNPRIDPTAAARNAMTSGTTPCWLAAITTIIGLGSLGLVRLWPVSAFGWIAAGSVLGTLWLLLWLLPGAMQMHCRRSQRHSINQNVDTRITGHQRFRAWSDGHWQSFAAKVLLYPIPVVILFFLFTAIMASGLPMLTTSVNVPRMFPAHSRIHRDYQWFEQHIGPTINAEILLRFDPKWLPDVIDQYRVVRDVDGVLRKFDGVGGIISARTFLPSPPAESNHSIRATMIETGIRNQTDPVTGSLARAHFHALSEDGQPIWRISFRFKFGVDMDYREKLLRVQDQIAPLTDREGVTVTYTGSVPMTSGSQDILLNDLFRSFLTAFGIVALIMMLLLRSFVGGLLAMFPNLFPTITLFGVMGLTDSPLDIGSVMTASVALGIAVDATIHLLSRFRFQFRQGLTRHAAAAKALKTCGPAMWQTTAVCAISPLVYGLSEFVPTQRFAIMMFGLLTAALIGDLLFMPAILASPLGRFLAPRLPSQTANAPTNHDR